jgi:hypothetical protein
MTSIVRRALRAMARNLNPAEDGVHYHAHPSGPYRWYDRGARR